MSEHIDSTQEAWKPVVGHEGIYLVSDHGRVRSLKYRTRRLLKPNPLVSGHLIVSLYDRHKNRRQALVNWLVLEAFVGPRPDGMWCCHWDDDPANNHLSNLRWDTPSGNVRDKRRNGRMSIGARNGSAVLTPTKVRAIVALVERGHTQSAVGKKFGVVQWTIGKIMNGETWTEVTGLKKAGAA